MAPADAEVRYSLNALHTTQYYRLLDGVLYYRTAKSDLEHAIPLHTVKSQQWRRYFDQYFWWGLMVTIIGLIYFAQIIERGPLTFEARHVPFAVGVVGGFCQAVYWARFPRVYRLVTINGDAVGIFVDATDPSRSTPFIETVQKEIRERRKTES